MNKSESIPITPQDANFNNSDILHLGAFLKEIKNPLKLDEREEYKVNNILFDYIYSVDKNLIPKLLNFATEEKKGPPSQFFSEKNLAAESSGQPSVRRKSQM